MLVGPTRRGLIIDADELLLGNTSSPALPDRERPHADTIGLDDHEPSSISDSSGPTFAMSSDASWCVRLPVARRTSTTEGRLAPVSASMVTKSVSAVTTTRCSA